MDHNEENKRKNVLIQWNCRGCIRSYCDIKMLLKKFNPICLCLQETHFGPEQPYSLKGYEIIRKDFENRAKKCGGVALFMRKGFRYSTLHLSTTIQAVAITVHVPMKITLCSIYFPNNSWEIDHLDHLIEQLPEPFIIMGDFNAHSPLWGSTENSSKGRELESWLENDSIVLLNTGSYTHFNKTGNTFTAIDLTLASSTVASQLSWRVEDDLNNSDHFPILVEMDSLRAVEQLSERWVMSRADWDLFTENLIVPDTISVRSVTNAILSAANNSIPKTGGNALKHCVPWWNAEVRDAIKTKKRSRDSLPIRT